MDSVPWINKIVMEILMPSYKVVILVKKRKYFNRSETPAISTIYVPKISKKSGKFGNAVEPGYNDIRLCVYNVRYSVAPINLSPVTITLYRVYTKEWRNFKS
jgi:hypothetical protein